MQSLPPALAALADYPQFIVYRLEPDLNRPGKTLKFPLDPRTLKKVGATNTEAWVDAQTAIDTAARLGNNHGVGFCLTKDDPFFLFDLDNCLITNEAGLSEWSPLAIQMCEKFKGAAIEVSSSGKGLHIIGSGVCPPHGCKDDNLNVELYTEARFIALTGTNAIGDARFDCSNILPWLINFVPKFSKQNIKRIDGWTTEPCAEWNGPIDDEDLINRALSRKSLGSVFGGGASFRDLWEANVDVLATAYPDETGTKYYNASNADMALAQHLAFWTGNDCERMQRLMFQSQLVRSKWDRDDYIPNTITLACGRATAWCNLKSNNLETSAPEAASTPVQYSAFLTYEQQRELFDACTYITDEHVILMPNGQKLKKEQFEAVMGGRQYLMDTTNRATTDNAWKAFLKFQGPSFPRADTSCFFPLAKPGEIMTVQELRAVNTWKPELTPRKKGDPTPFLNHIKKLLPDPRDQLLLLGYVAAIVQYPGVKFKYAPFLQGMPGNGKSLIANVIAYAVGKRHTYSPGPAILTEKFNSWLFGTLFIPVIDLLVESSEQAKVLEILKPWITDQDIEIRYPGGMRQMKSICCNFLFISNSKTGLNKTSDDRRLMPLYCKQQKKGDLQRDGLTPAYFTMLYHWLEKEDGYAIMNEFLNTYEIPQEYNPSYLQPAPETSSTEDAIRNGFGSVEQEIIERVEQGATGFKNGWASSYYIDNLLRELKATRLIPLAKRRELMQTLGYDWHQAFKDGRVNNIILPDAHKSKLFIHKDHPDSQITCAIEAARAYTDSQIKS